MASAGALCGADAQVRLTADPSICCAKSFLSNVLEAVATGNPYSEEHALQKLRVGSETA
jgi:hypothetical protein